MRTASAQRKTYVVVKDSPKSAKRRLVCFAEDVKRNKDGEGELLPPTRKECKLPEGNITSLDALPSVLNEQISVNVNYKDGAIEFVSGDLSNTRREELLLADGNEVYEVEYATLLDTEAARRGFLKGREDIMAQLEQSRTSRASSVLLCRLARSAQDRQLELCTIRDVFESDIQTAKPAAKMIVGYDLPLSGHHGAKKATYELHAASGMLYQLLGSKLNIYDLTGIVPKLVTTLGAESKPVTSFSRTSYSSVLTISADTATLFEISYASVQASVSLASPGTSESAGKKRKREEVEQQPALFQAISCLTDLGFVVGIKGHELTAIPFSNSLRSSKKAKRTLLSDAMGKGSLKEASKSKKKAKKWEEWRAKIDALVEAEDTEGMAKLVADDPCLGKQSTLDAQNGLVTALMLDRDDAYDLWPVSEPFDPQLLDQQKVLYIISKMFSYSNHKGVSVEVRFATPRLMEWLALTGFLTVYHLWKAVRPGGGENSTQVSLLKAGDVMGAIKTVDSDFQLMNDLLSLPVHWEVEEVIQALQALLQSFEVSLLREPQLALPEPPKTNGNVEMTNGDVDSHLAVESQAAEKELEHALTALFTGREVRSDTLREVFARLHAFPQTTVTATMRAMMSHQELIFFIHVLRIELAEGGWTSKYVGGTEDPNGEVGEEMGMVDAVKGNEEESPNDQAIKAIGNLLNCAVDAIGTSGWLVGRASAGSETDELIHSLRAEVSAGLEGCWEADKLGSLLAELERYGASNERVKSRSGKRAVETSEAIGEENALLPLGSRVEPPVVGGRNESGGKKSKMARAREKSRNVGKYSIDRIRI